MFIGVEPRPDVEVHVRSVAALDQIDLDICAELSARIRR